MTSEPLPSLLLRREVAQRARCHERTVARAERRGELRAIKINRLVRYDARDVAAWIEKSKLVQAGVVGT